MPDKQYPPPDLRGLDPRPDLLARTHCDVCRRTRADGARLQWFGSSAVMCERQECRDEIRRRWNAHCLKLEQDEEDARAWL